MKATLTIPDVFGRIRREVQAATADLAASEQDRRNVLITVLGDVGRFYAEPRGFQLRLAIAEENIAVAEDTLRLTRALAQAGQQTERDVAQAEAQLESLRAQVPTLQSSIALSIHRLGVLTEQNPGALDVEPRESSQASSGTCQRAHGHSLGSAGTPARHSAGRVATGSRYGQSRTGEDRLLSALHTSRCGRTSGHPSFMT
jgi:outer membrane protein TolC